jgi:GT2 family glycosyltransferase
MSRVGFLWDSMSANTGDQALGLALLRLAGRAGLQRLEPVRLGEPLAERFGMIVIGGGELLHPSGHRFYDVFRIPGEHVLNTMGTRGEVEARYLQSYRLVTVRSAVDRANLRGLSREVKVAPCLSVLFADLVEDRPVTMESGSLLLHVHAGVCPPSKVPALVSLLRRLDRPIAFLPFTPYNCDGLLQAVLANAIGLATPLAVAGPDEAFSAIRRARAVLVSSLHATLFAYIAGVPFLALSCEPKIRNFLVERGLEDRLLVDIVQLPAKLHLLSRYSVDWHASLAKDRAAATRSANETLGLVDEFLARPDGRLSIPNSWTAPCHPQSAHTQMIEEHAEYGRRTAQMAETMLATPLDCSKAVRLPRVHAVMVEQRSDRQAEQALSSLMACQDVDLRVILIASACAGTSLGRSYGDRVTVMRWRAPLGLSAANNRGTALARRCFGEPEYWFFSDGNTCLEPQTLARLVAALERTPHGGISSPRLMIRGEHEDSSSLSLDLGQIDVDWRMGIGMQVSDDGVHPARREVAAVTGAALLVGAEPLTQCGGWSELFDRCHGDVDLCLRTRSFGWRVIREPAATVQDTVPATPGQAGDVTRIHVLPDQLLLVARHCPREHLAVHLSALIGQQARLLFRSLGQRRIADALLQVRAWCGAVRRLPAALAEREEAVAVDGPRVRPADEPQPTAAGGMLFPEGK